MTPIQAAALPPALLGKDLIAQAKTGSGKTAAFALTLLANLNARRFAVQTLVLCPTRELADQVTAEIRRLARAEDNIKVVTLCGGVPLRGQMATLEHGAHVVVGTPGRVMDHLDRGSLQLDALNTLVLDEADRMLDMGFFDDMVKVAAVPARAADAAVLGHLPRRHRQAGRRQFMRQPATVKVEAQHSRRADRAALVRGERRRAPGGRRPPARSLPPRQHPGLLQHQGALPRGGRVAAGAGLQRAGAVRRPGAARARPGAGAFANRSCSVLVATDVAARGLDIANLAA
jgi:ATP-independent RNA helicase DbpA